MYEKVQPALCATVQSQFWSFASANVLPYYNLRAYTYASRYFYPEDEGEGSHALSHLSLVCLTCRTLARQKLRSVTAK